jgi:NADH-quinone oxidoreductase subunit N
MNELNLIPAMAEIVLAIAIMVILVAGLFVREEKQPLSHWLSLLAIVITAFVAMSGFGSGGTSYTFNQMFVSDPMAKLLKLFACIATFATLIYARQYTVVRGMLGGTLSGEFYVLALMTCWVR